MRTTVPPTFSAHGIPQHGSAQKDRPNSLGVVEPAVRVLELVYAEQPEQPQSEGPHVPAGTTVTEGAPVGPHRSPLRQERSPLPGRSQRQTLVQCATRGPAEPGGRCGLRRHRGGLLAPVVALVRGVGSPFAEVVREVEQQPVVPADDYSGVVDPSGRRWHQHLAEISPARALELAKEGAPIAWGLPSAGPGTWQQMGQSVEQVERVVERSGQFVLLVVE